MNNGTISHFHGSGSLVLSLIAALILLPDLLWAENFEINQIQTQLQNETYVLDANIRYRLNDTVQEALEHGVPLTMVLHLQVLRRGAWFWQQSVVDFNYYRVLRFHALTGLYEVLDQAQGRSQSFATQEMAIYALGEIQGLPVVDQKQLEEGESYLLELHTQLDIESLPLTLRPQAYLTQDWNLSSSWNVNPLLSSELQP